MKYSVIIIVHTVIECMYVCIAPDIPGPQEECCFNGGTPSPSPKASATRERGEEESSEKPL